MKTSLQQLQTPIILVIITLVLFFTFSKAFGPIPFAVDSVETTKSNTFQVTGTGKVSDAPDSAQVDFGVTKSASTIADAQNQTNSLIASITSALQKEGIEDKNMKTTTYNVTPNYDLSGGHSTITGYTVTQTLQLSIQPLDKTNKVLDILTANGANLVNQVSFTFSDSKKQDLEKKARDIAVAEAKQKAEGLSQAAGMRLGKIIDVQEQPNDEPRPIMPMALSKDTAANGTPTQVTPGENTISVTVTLSYQTL